jgi:hypothetical protein
MHPSSTHGNLPDGPLIELVTTGMHVVDATGAGIGRVSAVQPGDPNAVTAQEPPAGDGVLEHRVPHPEQGDEPTVPADLAARLLRTGYLRVTRDGAASGDLYVAAGQITAVRGDVVELTVPRDALPAAHG